MSTLETMFREACSQLRSTMGPKADLVALEERIRSELDAIGRELMREAYAFALPCSSPRAHAARRGQRQTDAVRRGLTHLLHK